MKNFKLQAFIPLIPLATLRSTKHRYKILYPQIIIPKNSTNYLNGPKKINKPQKHPIQTTAPNPDNYPLPLLQ